MTALAFGCDAVLPKPATPDLVDRIHAALARTCAEDADPVGASGLLRLLRCRLAETIVPETTHAARLTEQDITKALLAYRRQGMSGLGRSGLAAMLAPQIEGGVQRGEQTHSLLLAYLREILQLGIRESVSILQGELAEQRPPAEQAAQLGISVSEYYRRRRDAVMVLLELLTKSQHR